MITVPATKNVLVTLMTKNFVHHVEHFAQNARTSLIVLNVIIIQDSFKDSVHLIVLMDFIIIKKVNAKKVLSKIANHIILWTLARLANKITYCMKDFVLLNVLPGATIIIRDVCFSARLQLISISTKVAWMNALITIIHQEQYVCLV
jgi:hypothetical protein